MIVELELVRIYLWFSENFLYGPRGVDRADPNIELLVSPKGAFVTAFG